jgi:hypothetical protein
VRLNFLAVKTEISRAGVFSTSGYVELEPADSARRHENAQLTQHRIFSSNGLGRLHHAGRFYARASRPGQY